MLARRHIRNSPLSTVFLQIAMILCAIAAVAAQETPPVEVPAEMDAIVRQMQFDQPTRIGGRLIMLDGYDEAIWLEWTEVFDNGSWKPVPPERQLLIYPKDASMMKWFRNLPKGTALRMTVQRDTEGKRRLLELESA